MSPILIANWWSLVIRGAVALTVGVVVLNSSRITIDGLVELFATYALGDGLVAFAGAMRAAEARQRSWPLAIEGLAGVVAGFIALSSPLYDLSPVYLIAAWALMTGILEIVAGLQLRTHFAGEWLLMASGFSSIVLGILVVILPLSTLSFWVGAYALLFGALLIVLGLRLRPLLRHETTGSPL